ncbi:glycosyl-4,4'-diaponeurosporenoate acyltransferase CrtO family protein [Alteromonas lipolytica]|uniref:Glycosyl-4,4'-diaponeurosporenoate acyltransferase n=1 Tax=Alteromonas lipolytica TaxID=1856405 RepID=A0A1E8FEF9_9ALTE|nr:hypothetical protein [Alteromonas lipolytica]OFI33978.1 hypothetical protein BFC17_20705 [Alteromonas lipolytica]GGF66697.1 hypothetical protein GCM10011338_18590 [Alteromonas lipolytica]
MTIHYIKFSIAICFISWVVALLANALLIKTPVYRKLENLNFVRSHTVNTLLGMAVIKWIVTKTPFRYFNQSIKLKDKNADLMQIRAEMTKAEVSHLLGFLFVLCFVIYQGLTVSIGFGLIILVFNILMNLYPSLLQQDNKRRLDRSIKRRQKHRHKSLF